MSSARRETCFVSINKSVHALLKEYVGNLKGGTITHVVAEAILEYINCIKTSQCKKCDDYLCFYDKASDYFKKLKTDREEDLIEHKADREAIKNEEDDYILKYGKKPPRYTLFDKISVSVRLSRVIYNKAIRMARKLKKSKKRFVEEAILFRLSKEDGCYRCPKYAAFRMERLFTQEMDNRISLKD